MLKPLTTLLIAILLLASGKNALAFQVVQTNIVSQETDAKKAVAVVANFLSVFEEGMLQPATGLVHSSSHSVRTITLGNANLNSASLNKINRHALFHYLTTPLSEVKPSTGLHIFLCVLLIWDNRFPFLLIHFYQLKYRYRIRALCCAWTIHGSY